MLNLCSARVDGYVFDKNVTSYRHARVFNEIWGGSTLFRTLESVGNIAVEVPHFVQPLTTRYFNVDLDFWIDHA